MEDCFCSYGGIEESLNKLSKPDSVALVASLESKVNLVNSDLVTNIRKMREGFYQIKSDLRVTKKTPKYSARQTVLEKQC